jgi:hypothetical protein
MAKACPISFKLVDGTLIRIGAFFVSSVVVAYLVTSQLFLLYLLAIDFYIRLYGHKPYSPIYQLSLVVKKTLNLKEDMTDAGAKRLAAQFGLLFSLILIVEAYLGLNLALYITASILLICAFLEALFDYCVGCKVYYIIKKVYPNFMS